MISLNHLPLNKIADKHRIGISQWAFTKRLEPLLQLYEEVVKPTKRIGFPQKKLEALTVNLGPDTKLKTITVLKKLFSDSKSFNGGLEILRKIKADWDDLLTGLPSRLAVLITEYDPLFDKHKSIDLKGNLVYDKSFKLVLDQLGHIFDYEDKFIKKEDLKKNWDAYRLAEALLVDVCPYCNRQYTNTIIAEDATASKKITYDKIIRPEFDHFFPQSQYPYLALSFYNLVPSCKVCNSSLKGQKVLNLTDHIHPYLGGYHDLIRFRTGIDLRDFLKDINMDIPVDMKVVGKPSQQLTRAEETMKVFKVSQIYQIHSETAREIFKKMTNNSKKYLRRAKVESTHGSKLFDTKQQLYRHFVGNYMDVEDFHRRPLAKLQHDIAEETGLLDFIKKLK
ncbi:hypothetical protein [Mucilaginibacter sp. UR6-11]|uniref:hypothetical protein n=1 Tax=Mucilaginibacter sp. UR6-11 TaxID=1435644 RepID=UPI001E28C449|nr:hypothetical protein [Mucilaginibacter sp. UR6-11]MCC8423586.1 hypothetical protein [Mucilaginibacter sp. UR6-11]